MALRFNFSHTLCEVSMNAYFVVVVKFCVQFAVNINLWIQKHDYDKHWSSGRCIIFIHKRDISYEA
jgi:hypothetical protein